MNSADGRAPLLPLVGRRLPLLLFILFNTLCPALFSCSDAGRPTTSEQRDLGHTVLRRGLEFRLTPGAVVTRNEESVQARASSPLPRLALSSGPDGARDVHITLENVHRDARLVVLRVNPLSSSEMLGCPDARDGVPIACAQQPDEPACTAPEVERPSNTRTELSFEATLEGCWRASYALEFDDDAAAEPLRIGVVGRTASLGELEDALEAATADEPDFIVLLGDNAENSSLNGLRQLELVRERVDYPAVILPGEEELVDGSRSLFLETFGPFDFRWDIKGVQHVAFYSADGELGEGGVARLANTISRLDDNRPKLAFTHTPPVDPIGPRDRGFEGELEGARTLSALSEHGVDRLFVGHINDTARESINDMRVHLTSVERTREFLWVVVDGDEVSVERREL